LGNTSSHPGESRDLHDNHGYLLLPVWAEIKGRNMKTLMLMRHGQEDWGGPLTETGKAQVDTAGQQLIEQKLVPDIILHSPIERAVETARRLKDMFQRVAGRDVPMKEVAALKNETFTQPADLASGAEETTKTLLAVTHLMNISNLSGTFGKAVTAWNAEIVVCEAPDTLWPEAVKAAKVVRTI
jgi:broad specificity phosphatase PhoE